MALLESDRLVGKPCVHFPLHHPMDRHGKKKRVVVPSAFWWLSLVGTLLLLSYALFGKQDSVFIFAYAFSWIPYIRNLVIHRRHKKAHTECPVCDSLCAPESNFCSACGAKLPEDAEAPAS
jgi:hypothetical protein